jgi:hypothetical protein
MYDPLRGQDFENDRDDLYFLKGIPMSSDDPIEYNRQIRKEFLFIAIASSRSLEWMSGGSGHEVKRTTRP